MLSETTTRLAADGRAGLSDRRAPWLPPSVTDPEVNLLRNDQTVSGQPVIDSGNEQVFDKRQQNGTFTTTVQPGGVTLISAVPTSGTGGTGELVSAQSGDCMDTAGNGTPGPYVYFPGTARSGPATADQTSNGHGRTTEAVATAGRPDVMPG